MILAVTGHRPHKLGGYSEGNARRIFRLAVAEIDRRKPSRVVTGMAQGWDQAVAEACWFLGIPFTAAVPCAEQDRFWPEDARRRYRDLLGLPSCTVHLVDPRPYSLGCMNVRNRWMVDHSDRLLALWDGTTGGTGACVAYAYRRQIPVENCWSSYARTPHGGG